MRSSRHCHSVRSAVIQIHTVVECGAASRISWVNAAWRRVSKLGSGMMGLGFYPLPPILSQSVFAAREVCSKRTEMGARVTGPQLEWVCRFCVYVGSCQWPLLRL